MKLKNPNWFDYLNYFLMILLCVVMIYPFLNVLALSLSDLTKVSSADISFYPKKFSLEGYIFVIENNRIWRAFFYTISYAVVGTFIMLLFTSMIAYSLAIPNFILRKVVVIYIIITMFFGGGLIPYFLLIKNLGLIDTFWVMVVPGVVSAWNVILFRTFFKGIPLEMRESAFMDGANDMRILFTIYLPLSKALLATFALFSLVGHWNSWFGAMIFLDDSRKWPIQMILRQVVIESRPLIGEGSQAIVRDVARSKTVQMAVIMAATIPILFVYPFIQKHFTKGIMLGSLKM